MSSMERKPEEPTLNMQNFRREMDALILEKNVPRELGINLNNLTEADALMWYKVKNYTKGSVTREDFEIYKNDTKYKHDRETFAGTIVANKLQPIWTKEELESMNSGE